MNTPAIDYGALARQAGAVGATPIPPAAPTVDYDALAKQSGAVATTTAPGQPTQQSHWYDTAVSELKELNTGFTTGLSQTGLTAEKAIGALPVVGGAFNRATADARAADVARATTPMDTPGRMAGNAIENIIEFASGDEALKGLSTLAKVERLAPLASTLKKLPPKMLEILANGARQTAVATAQSGVHGNDLKTALTTGAIAGVGGVAAEGLLAGIGKVVSKIAPSTTEALGETLPVLASQKPGAAPMAADIASIGDEQATSQAQQLGAQRGIVNRAQQTAKAELEKLNAARQARWETGARDINLAPDAEPAVAAVDRQLPSGAAQLPADTTPPSGAAQLGDGTGAPPEGLARTDEIGPHEGDFAPTQPTAAQPTTQPGATQPATPGRRVSYIEEKPPNFQPIDSDAEVQNIRSFGDAAQKIRQHAAPIFDRFDKATGGEYTRLRKVMNDAYNNEDYAAAHKAEDGIDALFSQTRGKIDRIDFQAAKSAWRSSKILDAVHSSVSRAFNISDESLAADADAWRGINGGKLQTGINRLTERYGRATVENVIGKDGLTGLVKIAQLTQTPQRAAMYGQVVGEVTNHMAGMMPSKGGVIGATIKEARKAVLHSIATSPTVARYVEYAARNKVAPKIFAPLIAATINGQVSGDSNATNQ